MKLDTPRPYRLKLKGEHHPYALTEQKFEVIHQWYHDAKNVPLDLTNDQGRYIKTIRRTDVDRLYQIEKTDRVLDPVVCDYGNEHQDIDECKCHHEYNNMSGIRFFRILTDELGHQIRYNKDITEKMQEEVKEWIKRTGYDMRPTTVAGKRNISALREKALQHSNALLKTM